jgi:hypothetical protein
MPKMRRKILLFLFVSLLIASPLLALRRHRCESVEIAEIVVDSPYPRVVMELSKKSSLESIVASGGGKILERSWDEVTMDLKRVPRLSSWEVKLRGKFRVEVSSEDFSGKTTVGQEMTAKRSGIKVESITLEPCGFVSAHETSLTVSNSQPSRVSATNRIVYERIVPFWMCKEVDRRVVEYNKSRLDSMMTAIRSILD